MYYIYVKHLGRNKHITFGFISFRNITWVSHKLKLKFFERYLVLKHKVSNMSAINNIEFKTTIKVESYFDALNLSNNKLSSLELSVSSLDDIILSSPNN